MSKYLLDLTHRPQLVVAVIHPREYDAALDAGSVTMAQQYANQTGREVTVLDDNGAPVTAQPHSIAAPPPAAPPVAGAVVAPIVPHAAFSIGSLGIDWNSVWNAVRPILQTVEPGVINALAAWLQSLLAK